jgi:LacI family repressor for deo operon, udp, cdd, tsx, nupC, and nupG
MSELLEARHLPTAVFCASDEMAIGALTAIRQAGLEAPRDISVMGFDDHSVAGAVDLTTIHQPVSAMAARAADMVLDRVAERSDGLRRTVLGTELIIRGSTGPVRRQS